MGAREKSGSTDFGAVLERESKDYIIVSISRLRSLLLEYSSAQMGATPKPKLTTNDSLKDEILDLLSTRQFTQKEIADAGQITQGDLSKFLHGKKEFGAERYDRLKAAVKKLKQKESK